MSATNYLETLERCGPLTEPAIREAIRSLGLSAGACVLDVGCGSGRHTLLLADTVGAAGKVVGLDVSAEHVEAARALSQRQVPAARVEFIQGSLDRLPFGDGVFDCVWCADTLWPTSVVPDPAEAVLELVRVLGEGGRMALMYCTGHCLLPGYAVLEARLDRAFVEATPYLADSAPQRQVMRALAWLEAAGLVEREGRTFAANVQAPLSEGLHQSVVAWMDMLWGGLQSRVSAEDWGALERLRCGPSPIHDLPDFYGFVNYTLFTGVRRRQGKRGDA